MKLSQALTDAVQAGIDGDSDTRHDQLEQIRDLILPALKELERQQREDASELRSRVNALAESSRKKGRGAGRGTTVASGLSDSPLYLKISDPFTKNFLIDIVAMLSPGWDTWSDNPRSYCMRILSALGYIGEGRKKLPASCGGSMKTFWVVIVPMLNTLRQNYNSNLKDRVVRRLNSK